MLTRIPAQNARLDFGDHNVKKIVQSHVTDVQRADNVLMVKYFHNLHTYIHTYIHTYLHTVDSRYPDLAYLE